MLPSHVFHHVIPSKICNDVKVLSSSVLVINLSPCLFCVHKCPEAVLCFSVYYVSFIWPGYWWGWFVLVATVAAGAAIVVGIFLFACMPI
jgi:hypothetical protein